MNIFNICVKDCDLDEKKISQLIDEICKRRGYSYWRSAEHYMEHSDEGYTWLEITGGCGLPDLNGSVSSEGPGRDVVEFDVWFDLAIKTIKGEEMTDVADTQKIIMKVENNPKPRYRKRNPKVAKVAKPVVRILYTTQQTYTLKNVEEIVIEQKGINIIRNNVITEGIEEKIVSVIDPKLVLAIIVMEPERNFFTTIIKNFDETWDSVSSTGLVSEKCGRITKALTKINEQ